MLSNFRTLYLANDKFYAQYPLFVEFFMFKHFNLSSKRCAAFLPLLFEWSLKNKFEAHTRMNEKHKVAKMVETSGKYQLTSQKNAAIDWVMGGRIQERHADEEIYMTV